jgi:hypothetical protein
VADDAGGDGDGVDTDEQRQRHRHIRGQQEPQDRGRAGQVDDGEQDLGHGHCGCGRTQRPAAQFDRWRAQPRPQCVEHDATEQRGTERADHGRRQVKRCGAGQHRESDGRGDAAEHRDGRNIRGAHARTCVQAVTDGGSREGRDAEVVPEGVGDEGGERGARIGQRLADVAQRQDVVEAEQPVADHRHQHRTHDRRRRNGPQAREDARQPDLGHFAVDHPGHGAEDEHGAGGQQPAAPELPQPVQVHRAHPARRCGPRHKAQPASDQPAIRHRPPSGVTTPSARGAPASSR